MWVRVAALIGGLSRRAQSNVKIPEELHQWNGFSCFYEVDASWAGSKGDASQPAQSVLRWGRLQRSHCVVKKCEFLINPYNVFSLSTLRASGSRINELPPFILTRLCDLLALSAAAETISEVLICHIFSSFKVIKNIFTLVMCLYLLRSMTFSFDVIYRCNDVLVHTPCILNTSKWFQK